MLRFLTRSSFERQRCILAQLFFMAWLSAGNECKGSVSTEEYSVPAIWFVTASIYQQCAHHQYLWDGSEIRKEWGGAEILQRGWGWWGAFASLVSKWMGYEQNDNHSEGNSDQRGYGDQSAGRDQALGSNYQDIKNILDEKEDVVLVLVLNLSDTIKFHHLFGREKTENQQQIREFTEFFRENRSPDRDASKILLIYNTKRKYEKKHFNVNGVDRPWVAQWNDQLKNEGLPVPDVTIFSSGQAICFGSEQDCKEEPSYSDYWKDGLDRQHERYNPIYHKYDTEFKARIKSYMQITYGIENYTISSGPELLFKREDFSHLQDSDDDLKEQYECVQSLAQENFVQRQSLETPVYQFRRNDPERDYMKFDFDYGHHRYFNKGAALSRTMNKLANEDRFKNKIILLVTVGAEIGDASMMAASMQHPFEIKNVPESLKPRPLPSNVTFIGSVLSETGADESKRPIVFLTRRFKEFKPIRSPSRGVSAIMTKVNSLLQRWVDSSN